MYPNDDGTRPISEIESVVALCIKHLDAADQPTRIALAQLVGHILASTQIERVIPPPEPPKRSKKAGEENDEDARCALGGRSLLCVIWGAERGV